MPWWPRAAGRYCRAALGRGVTVEWHHSYPSLLHRDGFIFVAVVQVLNYTKTEIKVFPESRGTGGANSALVMVIGGDWRPRVSLYCKCGCSKYSAEVSPSTSEFPFVVNLVPPTPPHHASFEKHWHHESCELYSSAPALFSPDMPVSSFHPLAQLSLSLKAFSSPSPVCFSCLSYPHFLLIPLFFCLPLLLLVRATVTNPKKRLWFGPQFSYSCCPDVQQKFCCLSSRPSNVLNIPAVNMALLEADAAEILAAKGIKIHICVHLIYQHGQIITLEPHAKARSVGPGRMIDVRFY